MISVIFEVVRAEGKRDAYSGIAGDLRPLLETIDGFISVERFQSLADSSKSLSLSFWRDEAPVLTWRDLEPYRAAQAAGREAFLADCRLRVASVIRDYGLRERDEAPADSPARHGQAA